MATFTTEKRRELTKTKAIADEYVLEQMGKQIDLTYADKVEADRANNGIFRRVNAELTGLAYEYRYLTGKYHPSLDELEVIYTGLDADNNYEEKSYWDNMKLHSAGKLETGNEFHLNTREGTTVSYPIRPTKYSFWCEDSNVIYVKDFETTENNLIAMVRTFNTWYTSGGGTGNIETTIAGPYSEIDYSLKDNEQDYMAIGYAGYQSDPENGYMAEGWDPTGELVLVNTGDITNFSFGKVFAAKDTPSRILLAPYGQKGTVPDDAVITSTFTAGTTIILHMAAQTIANLELSYRMSRHYLEFNPKSEDADNAIILTGLDTVIDLIEVWENVADRYTFTRMIELMDNIQTVRNSTMLSNRIAYINAYLITEAVEELYEDRFNILDLRLSKVGGTLKDIMTIEKGNAVINKVLDEQSNSLEWYKKFFIVKRAQVDGDYYRRLFIANPDGLEVGDWCYILSDNENVKEIYAEITHIVYARVEDPYRTTYDDEGNIFTAYKESYKIFFNGVIFSADYITSEDLRIIKEIS